MSDLLAKLAAGEGAALVGAIEAAEQRLKDDSVAADDVLAIGRALVPHRHHARSDVRKAVAWAARYLPDALFEETIAVLRADRNQFVKRAAERACDERVKRRRTTRIRDEQAADVRAVRARIESTWGAGAVRLADRLQDRALSQFVESLHHELAKIGASLRLDLDELRRDARQVTGDRLGAPADEVLGKLDALFAIVQSARAQVRRAEPSFREERLRPLVEGHLELLRARLDEGRRGRLRVEVVIEDAIAIDLDKALFGQALANALQNAVEAYPAKGEEPIVVLVEATEKLAGTCALRVTDRGCGIGATDLARIGEPFASSKGTGRGLGMMNIRRMIEAVHGGSVTVTSKVGEGTCVVLELPRKQ